MVFSVFYLILQITWGIVQNLFGALLWLILRIVSPEGGRYRFREAVVTEWKRPYSMGLGMFIFFGHAGDRSADGILVHEYGHTVQSMLLGPLFLPVIGLPSVLWAFLPCFVRLRKQRHLSYMSAYCEKWANRLGSAVTGIPASEV